MREEKNWWSILINHWFLKHGPKTNSLASYRNLLDMQILRPHVNLLNPVLWGWGPATSFNMLSRGALMPANVQGLLLYITYYFHSEWELEILKSELLFFFFFFFSPSLNYSLLWHCHSLGHLLHTTFNILFFPSFLFWVILYLSFHLDYRLLDGQELQLMFI